MSKERKSAGGAAPQRQRYDEAFKLDPVRLRRGRPSGECPAEGGTGAHDPSARHFKKGHGHRQPGPEERFEIIRHLRSGSRTDYTLGELCKAMEVSRSGYYAHLQKPEGARSRKDRQLEATLANARLFIHDYIDAFYNTRRLHSSLGFQPPHRLRTQPAAHAELTYDSVSTLSLQDQKVVIPEWNSISRS